jgi:hypothetical protein
MPAIGNTYLNLIDAFKRTEDGQVAASIIEMLTQTNPILDDAIAVECNMGMIHRHTVRTGLPSVAWGKLYQGTPQSKSTTQQVDDATGFLEAMSSVDTRVLDLAPNGSALRLSEAQPFLEAMNQEMAATLFYSDTATTPEKFKGLGARFGLKATSGAGAQIIDALGTGSDLTSIWFVTWNENTCTLLYPKGTKAGVFREDMGRQRVLDGSNNPYFVMEEKFSWHMGVAVKDWRFIARIANIDLSDLAAGTVDLYKYMRQAYYKLQGRRQNAGDTVSAGRKIAIYCNRNILEALDALAHNKATADSLVRLTRDQIEGKEVISYRGIPIRETDALLNTETRVL